MHQPQSRYATRLASYCAPRVKGALAFAVIALGAAAPARAQHGNGYLFHAPEARISVRGGYALARAGSDLFSYATDQLTLKKGDFSAFAGDAEFSVPITARFDLSFDAGYTRSAKGSEFRHFIDNKDQPIEQTTVFERLPLMANVRYNLAPAGRSIGKLAWIPTAVVPYVGAGGGAMWYRFNQEGDFVDFNTSNVFHSQLNSANWTPAVQAMSGAEFNLTPFMALATDVRYIWARSRLGTDFSGFDKIDLSGVSATLGLTFRL